jgi:hypothetical protein
MAVPIAPNGDCQFACYGWRSITITSFQLKPTMMFPRQNDPPARQYKTGDLVGMMCWEVIGPQNSDDRQRRADINDLCPRR